LNDLERIRNRKSYKLFSKEAEFFSGCGPGDMPKILKHIFELLDGRRAFGSRTNAYFAEESMEQAIKDFKAEEKEMAYQERVA